MGSSRSRFTLDWMSAGPDWRIVAGPEITDSKVKAPVLELRWDCFCQFLFLQLEKGEGKGLEKKKK